MAKLLAGDTTGIQLLAQAVDDHRRQCKLDKRMDDSHYVHLLHLSEANLLLGSGYTRVNRFTQARAAFNDAHQTAQQILAATDIQDNLRAGAKRFVEMSSNLEAGLPK